MNRERAIEILNDELQHNKIHLQEKGKAPEYYKELGDICEALELAIKELKLKNSITAEQYQILYREETCERKQHCNDYAYWNCIGCNGTKNCYNCDLYEDAMDDYCQYAGECVPIQSCKYFVQKKEDKG